MPAKTEKQRRFMGACMNPIVRSAMAKKGKKCPPMDVAREFAHKKKK